MVYGVKAINPQHDNVLVKRCAPPAITPGGVHMFTEEEQKHAIVLAVGPGRAEVPATFPLCKRGDVVLIDRFVGIKLTINGQECNMVKWGDICAVLELTESGKAAIAGELEALNKEEDDQ